MLTGCIVSKELDCFLAPNTAGVLWALTCGAVSLLEAQHWCFVQGNRALHILTWSLSYLTFAVRSSYVVGFSPLVFGARSLWGAHLGRVNLLVAH